MSPHAVEEADNANDTMDHVNGAATASRTLAGRRAPGVLSVHLTTFNCANNIHPRFPVNLPALPPDVLVLGLQELAPTRVAFLNLPVIESTYLKGLDDLAPVASKQYGLEYKHVKTVRIGQTAVAVWTKLGQKLRKVETAYAGCGLFGLLSNKGAAAVRLTFVSEDNVERQVTFVAAHLAAHEGHFNRRNADFQSLVQNLVFPDETGIFKPHVPLFFLGDLNYRLSVLHPSRSDTNLQNISPEEQAESDLSLMSSLKGQIMDFLETGKFTNLVPHDQLPLSPLALHLHESPITFRPTYKYVSYDPPMYASTRIPSWTDRILYSPETILTHDYTSTTSATFSDHQAVSMGAVLQEGDFSGADGDMPWGINTRWRGRQAFGENLGYLFGAIEVMGETKAGVLMGAMVVAAVTYYMYR